MGGRSHEMMKRLACFAVAAIVGSRCAAASAAHLQIASPSSLALDGSSNIARWRCSGETLNGSMDVSAPMEKINRDPCGPDSPFA